MTTSLKYRVDISQFRALALWQFGGYAQNNGANGGYSFQAGGDIPDLAKGVLSLDAIYTHIIDSVSIGLSGNPLGPAGNPLPPFLPQVLTATISDNTSVTLLGKYTNGPLKLYGGYEWIQFAPPSNPQTAFTDIGGNALVRQPAKLRITQSIPRIPTFCSRLTILDSPGWSVCSASSVAISASMPTMSLPAR